MRAVPPKPGTPLRVHGEPFPGAPAQPVVVLDPPRTGAKREVVQRVARLAARAVVYVACDPAALARDVDTFGLLGWRLAELRAFDLFPMTHHVECVALLEPSGQPADGPASSS